MRRRSTSRAAWLLLGTALAVLAWPAAPPPAQAQSQRESTNARNRLWEPRDARRARSAAFGQAGLPPGPAQLLPAPAEDPPAALPGAPTAPPSGAPSGVLPPAIRPAPARPVPLQAPDRNAPVTFTAETISYDEPSQTVTAVGRVEAWQNDRVLQADRVTFDRRTGVAQAEGNVVLLEPDGQVLFAERATLNQDFSAGVAQGMRGLLAENGRLAATAARRRDGRLTEMFRGVYSTCDPCEQDPNRAPLWQITARRVQHDQVTKRVEHFGPTLQMAGIPVLYLPYLSHPDPTVQRASGLLAPSFGQSNFLGSFASLPYFGVLDAQSDVTIEPILTSKQGPVLAGEYRRRFNSGFATFRGSGTNDESGDWRGHIFGTGRFTVNETWRTGFDIGRVSDISYLRNYRFGSPRFLTTRPFVEGFWNRSYALLDASAYQGLSTVDSTNGSPLVLPRFLFATQGQDGTMGGRYSLDFGSFSISRNPGTDTRRMGGRAGWATELADGSGGRWSFGGRLDLYGYNYSDWGGNNPATTNGIAVDSGNLAGSAGIAHPQVFGMWRLPLYRRYTGVTHLVEPIVQAILAPNTPSNGWPNEDSRDVEFTDANLFALNRFPGRDRLEGGARMNYGLRNAFFLPNGMSIDTLVGQSLRAHRDDSFDAQSGLSGRASDYVARIGAELTPWLGVAYRTRFANDQLRQTFTDLSATLGQGPFTAVASYVLVPPSRIGNRPFRREEVGGAALVGPFRGTAFENWRGIASASFDLEQNRFVATAFGAAYEDECFIFDVRYVRSFTNPDLEAIGGTAVLFQLTFKSIGDFGFSAF